MSENKIIVSSIEELIRKAEEFAVSQGGTGEIKIGSSVVNLGNYVYREGKTVKDSEGFIKINLEGQNNSSIKLVLKDNKTKISPKPSINHKIYQNCIQELTKQRIIYRKINR